MAETRGELAACLLLPCPPRLPACRPPALPGWLPAAPPALPAPPVLGLHLPHVAHLCLAVLVGYAFQLVALAPQHAPAAAHRRCSGGGRGARSGQQSKSLLKNASTFQEGLTSATPPLIAP